MQFDGATGRRCIRCQAWLVLADGPVEWVYCPGATQDTESFDTSVDAETHAIEANAPSDLERFEILEEVGRGGMGVVYRAHDTVLNRQVALKFLLRGAWATTYQRERFHREVLGAAKATAPGTVQVYDGGVTTDGIAWYAMELIEGPTLAEVLKDRGKLPLDEVFRIGIAMTTALEDLHVGGLAHRDVKPSNVLLHVDGRPVLADFGLVADLSGEARSITHGPVGTLDYIAPEQLLGSGSAEDLTLVDVYALGILLAEAATGIVPERRADHSRVLHAVPPPLRNICENATQFSPSERTATMTEFREQLQLRDSPRTSTRPRLGRYAAGIALGVAIMGGFLWVFSPAENAIDTAALARLNETWPQIAAVADTRGSAAGEVALERFLDAPDNRNTTAAAEGWLRWAERSGFDHVALPAWAHAMAASTDAERTVRARHGLLMTLETLGNREAIDAVVRDLDDAQLTAYVDPSELGVYRAELAAFSRDLDRARNQLPDTDSRRDLVRRLSRGARATDDVGDTYVDIDQCARRICWNGDGEVFKDPRTVWVPQHPLPSIGIARDGSRVRTLAGLDCPLPHATEDATWWRGQIVLTASVAGSLSLLDPATCEARPFTHPGLAGRSSIREVDVDGNDALVAALGGPWGHGVAVFDNPDSEPRTVRIGHMRGVAAYLDHLGEPRIAALATNMHPNRYLFPEGEHTGAQGLTVLTPSDLEVVRHFRAPRWRGELPNFGKLSAVDLDGNGLHDLIAYYSTELPIAQLHLQQPDGRFEVLTLGGIVPWGPIQADGDPELELMATIDGSDWILGMGDMPIPPLNGAPKPEPPETDDPWTRAERLIPVVGAEVAGALLERGARSSPPELAAGRWAKVAAHYNKPHRPAQAAAAWVEAATAGDPHAWTAAIEKYLEAGDIAAAVQTLDTAVELNLPETARRELDGWVADMPTERLVLDFAAAPEAWALDDRYARWNGSTATLEIQAIAGAARVAGLVVERTSDIVGVSVESVAHRLEQGSGIRIALRQTDLRGGGVMTLNASGNEGGIVHLGAGTVTTRPLSIADESPTGPHSAVHHLVRTPHRTHVMAKVEGEESLARLRAPLSGDELVLTLAADDHGQLGSMARVDIHRIVLYGLRPVRAGQLGGTKPSWDDRVAAVRLDPSAVRRLLEDNPTREVVEVIENAFAVAHRAHGDDPFVAGQILTAVDNLPAGTPTPPALQVIVANALWVAGRHDESERAYAAIDAESDLCSEVAAGRARAARSAGDERRARKHLDEALRCSGDAALGAAHARRLGANLD